MTQQIDQNWEAIVSYMSDELREQAHNDCAPCSNEGFLLAYIALDPEFKELLDSAFGLNL